MSAPRAWCGRALAVVIAAALVGGMFSSEAAAQSRDADSTSRSGKLLLTGGVTSVEGAAGGGLTPWAVIGGYGAAGQTGANAFVTRVELPDYRLDTAGFLVGFDDRVELSYARQRFALLDVGAALGLGRGFTLDQDIFGAKFRVAGDAVLDQDNWLPQISLGLLHKRNRDGDLVRALGAASAFDTEAYLSATKLLLGEGLLLNGTLRYTRANQFGLLGFGGDARRGRRIQGEGSAALLLRRDLAIGAEYRMKPDNLGIAREDDVWDLFVAWAPSKRVSVTLAWVDLGNITIVDRQRGAYLSLQVGF